MFLAFVALATFAVIEYLEVGSLNREVASLTQEIERLKTPEVVERSNATQIICPLCHGEKFITVQASNPIYNRRELCPLCRGVGSRMLTVPAGSTICPDCKGMGLVYSQQGLYVRTGGCARCGGTGLVAATKEPSH